MEIKEYRNTLILSTYGNPKISSEEQEKITNFGKMLHEHGIEYTEGKAETLRVADIMQDDSFRYVLYLHFDDVNFTAYKFIKD